MIFGRINSVPAKMVTQLIGYQTIIKVYTLAVNYTISESSLFYKK